MVTDEQVKRLWQVLSSGKTLVQSADKASMDEKTARKYRRLGRLPSEVVPDRSWRTRADLFAEVWPEVHAQLHEALGLEAKTLFGALQIKYPGKFDETQLHSFQRGVKRWRATAGPAKEVFFSQVHHPGRLCASDFTHMESLAVIIGGQSFDHLLYHFVLTYSNWESVTVCFSESFEKPRRRTSRRPVGIGRRARTTPHGSDEPGGQQRIGHEGVHRAVQGTVGLLRDGDGEDPAPGTERERRCRTIASAFQGSGGAGPVIAWQPGLREP